MTMMRCADHDHANTGTGYDDIHCDDTARAAPEGRPAMNPGAPESACVARLGRIQSQQPARPPGCVSRVCFRWDTRDSCVLVPRRRTPVLGPSRYDGEWVADSPKCGYYTEMPPDPLVPASMLPDPLPRIEV